jgi:hypothetical protein
MVKTKSILLIKSIKKIMSSLDKSEPFNIKEINSHIWEIIVKYIDRVSFINLAKTCKYLYLCFHQIIKNREEWQILDLYNQYSISKIIENGYRFIRINDEFIVYRLIHYKHKIELDNKNKLRHDIVLYVINDNGLAIKMIGYVYNKRIEKIEVLKKSPTMFKIKPLSTCNIPIED